MWKGWRLSVNIPDGHDCAGWSDMHGCGSQSWQVAVCDGECASCSRMGILDELWGCTDMGWSDGNRGGVVDCGSGGGGVAAAVVIVEGEHRC